MATHAYRTRTPVVQPDLLPAIGAVTTSIKSTLDRMCAEATGAVFGALVRDDVPPLLRATVAQNPCQADTPMNIVPDENDIPSLPPPAPLPSLTAAFSRRRAIFGAVKCSDIETLDTERALASSDLALAQVRHARQALDDALDEQPIEQTFRSEGAGLPHVDFADVTDLASLDLARLRHARRMASDAIDHLIALLDALDAPDEDREPVGDEEPSLGWQEGSGAANGAVEDLEEDTADNEFCLGWNETVSQLALGRASDDGDDTALERAGRGFIRSGHDDAEDDDPAERDDEHGSDDGEDINHFASNDRFTLRPLTEAQREQISVLAHRAATVRRVLHV